MPNRMCGLAAVLVGVWCAGASGQGPDVTKPIVDKAVGALGGADKQKWAGMTFDTEAKFMAGDATIDFSGSWSAQSADKINASIKVTNNGMQNGAVVVMNGSQIWAQDEKSGKTESPPADITSSVQGLFRLVRFAQRPGLLLNKDIKLSALGELLVNNVTCVGLKIEQKGHKDMSLFFDKATGLPAKAEILIKEGGGAEATYVFLFSEFKEADGVKHFTKMTVQRDQQKVTEVQFSNIRLAEQMNANLFMKP